MFEKKTQLECLYKKAYYIFMIENRDASEQRTLSDKCGLYLTWSM